MEINRTTLMDSIHTHHLQPTDSGKTLTVHDDPLFSQSAESLGQNQPSDQLKDTATSSNVVPDKLSSLTILTDTQLLRNRRLGLNNVADWKVEVMCEEKIAKYKVDEVHCSLPSASKTTLTMTFSPDGQRVASTHGDHRIYICDMLTGKHYDTLTGHPKTPWCMAWHPTDRNLLASGCLAGEVRIWDLENKLCHTWVNPGNLIILSVSFHPKERLVVFATGNFIHFWDWTEESPFLSLMSPHERERVKYVEFDSSGTKLITGISNLSKIALYPETLNSRILEHYISQTHLELPAGITQSSETTRRLIEPTSSSGPIRFVEPDRVDRVTSPIPPTVLGVETLASTITWTLFRVACLYRNLEALEDSMRHTSFSPFISSDPSTNSNSNTSSPSSGPSADSSGTNPTDANSRPSEQAPSIPDSSVLRTCRAREGSNQVTPNAYEPLVVLFDDLLETMQLKPISLSGTIFDINSIMNHMDLPNNLNTMMRFESINQVNQNFIRISKLMSSIRLYRQVIRQIEVLPSAEEPIQPNQILTARTSSPSHSRLHQQLPAYLRNFNNHVTGSVVNLGAGRSTDSVQEFSFRQSYREVPITAVCKTDMLNARSRCMLRSQQSLEYCLINRNGETVTLSLNDELADCLRISMEMRPTLDALNSHSYQMQLDSETIVIPPLYSDMNKIQRALSLFTHATLSTSNVHTHIKALKQAINSFHVRFTMLFQERMLGSRLLNLIQDIAHSLTGRNYASPPGTTIDELRLDVIHTVIVTDLTLHLARQCQLLELQRIAAVARVLEYRQVRRLREAEENAIMDLSRRSRIGGRAINIQHRQDPGSTRPSTTRDSGANNPLNKRGSPEHGTSSDVAPKRPRVDAAPLSSLSMHDPILDLSSTDSPRVRTILTENSPQTARTNSSRNISPFSINDVLERSPNDISLVSPVEPQIHRFLLAAHPGNFYVLTRVFQRFHGTVSAVTPLLSELLPERQNPPYELRRRALSHDHSMVWESSHALPPDTEQRRNFLSGLTGPALEYWRSNLHIYVSQRAAHNLMLMHPAPLIHSNYRLQCWDFSLPEVPKISDPFLNILATRCRIDGNYSVDISKDNTIIACFVAIDDARQYSTVGHDLRILSLKPLDLGTCYYSIPQAPQMLSVSLSPSCKYAVVGLATGRQPVSINETDDGYIIGRVFELTKRNSFEAVRDIDIKHGSPFRSVNAIKWMPRGIVYNVGSGPSYHQRYQARRFH